MQTYNDKGDKIWEIDPATQSDMSQAEGKDDSGQFQAHRNLGFKSLGVEFLSRANNTPNLGFGKCYLQ